MAGIPADGLFDLDEIGCTPERLLIPTPVPIPLLEPIALTPKKLTHE